MEFQHGAIVFASLAADALALGAHWIYDTGQIDAQVGRVDTLRAPLPTSFHKTKTRGDLTHYGDQTVVLLNALAESGGFSEDVFARMWRELLAADYNGYRDHATKETLKQFEEGRLLADIGSSSSDLGGAARIAPLVYFYRNDTDAMVAAARRQTAMTHRNTDVIDSAAFFAQVTAAVLGGQEPTAALQDVARLGFDRPPFKHWVSEGLGSHTRDTRAAIGQFGQACDVSAGFPGVVHLIAKYQDNPRDGLVENVMAGGDSAARGLLAGMVFGAYCGMDAIPQEWVADLNSRGVIERCLKGLEHPQAE
ncbi:MAG: ADP-ribosylglycohydrolase family protein [Desulfobacteraceae bacterium]|nr:ADP-ribosylglycohydrolase family protein [Desulfobacteraceae bacterium]MBC2750675.1 ADP-ribosylglycohydrolase family protein [Desulfobacteraceae bacterium]